MMYKICLFILFFYLLSKIFCGGISKMFYFQVNFYYKVFITKMVSEAFSFKTLSYFTLILQKYMIFNSFVDCLVKIFSVSRIRVLIVTKMYDFKTHKVTRKYIF